jgi:hypothetical protein
MTTGRQTITSYVQRWREGSVASCFAWPSNETVRVDFLADETSFVVLNDEKLADWRHRVSRGQNAVTRWVAQSCTLEYTPGHIFLGKWCGNVNRFGWYQYDGDLIQGQSTAWSRPGAPGTALHSKTDDEALMRAIKDARSKQSHFRGGNFLAELRDTLRGIRNPAKGFRDLLDTYRRNARRNTRRAAGRRAVPTTQEDFRRLERDSPRSARAVQRALSDTWLESNFGWQPLLSDAVDSYQALRRLAARVPLVRFFGQSSNDDPPTYASGQRSLEVTQLVYTVRTHNSYDCRYYGAVKIETQCASGAAIEEMGVRARDFVPAVWEAIPYSFLIDYFTNVGDVIEAASFPQSDLAWAGRTFRNHSSRSTERVAIVEPSSPAYPANNSNKVFSFAAPSVKWRRTYWDRSKVMSFSAINRLRFEIPGSKNWRKWFNIAALARLRTL